MLCGPHCCHIFSYIRQSNQEHRRSHRSFHQPLSAVQLQQYVACRAIFNTQYPTVNAVARPLFYVPFFRTSAAMTTISAGKPNRYLFIFCRFCVQKHARKKKKAKRDKREKESETAMEATIKLWKEFQNRGLYEGLRPDSAANLLHSLFTACYKHDKHWPTVRRRSWDSGWN